MYSTKQIIRWGMMKLKRFDVIDIALFKVCLLSLGSLFGIYFVKPLKRLLPLIWFVTVFAYVYLVWRMVFCDD